jgi:hypothetical protein
MRIQGLRNLEQLDSNARAQIVEAAYSAALEQLTPADRKVVERWHTRLTNSGIRNMGAKIGREVIMLLAIKLAQQEASDVAFRTK